MNSCNGKLQVLHTKTERNKTRPLFEKEAFLEDNNTVNPNYKPIRNSLYHMHMERWLRYFPLQNFLILDGDKFIEDPLPEVIYFFFYCNFLQI